VEIKNFRVLKPPEHKEFLKLLLQHRQAIFAYILALVPSRVDAEDILQEATVTMFEKFADFELGTDFRAWAFRVAYWKVRQARQKFARGKLVFDDDVMASVASTVEELQDEVDIRHRMLGKCLKKLGERDRRMVLVRYESGSSAARAAGIAGRSIQAAYKSLSRIKQLLRDCVEQEIASEREVL